MYATVGTRYWFVDLRRVAQEQKKCVHGQRMARPRNGEPNESYQLVRAFITKRVGSYILNIIRRGLMVALSHHDCWFGLKDSELCHHFSRGYTKGDRFITH